MNCSSESAILFVVVCVGASVKRPITLLVEINTSDDFEMENFFAGNGGEKMEICI